LKSRKTVQNLLAVGALPQNPLGELMMLPKLPSRLGRGNPLPDFTLWCIRRIASSSPSAS